MQLGRPSCHPKREILSLERSHSKRKTCLWGAAGGAWNCPESEVNLTFSVGRSA